MSIRYNLLASIGPELGILGEALFARLHPNAARGEAVAILLEGLYSSTRVEGIRYGMPEDYGETVSRHVSSRWPLHKSWFVPVMRSGTPMVLLDPPRGLVRYLGKDDGRYAYILKLGLEELRSVVMEERKGTLLEGLEDFSGAEIQVARELAPRLEKFRYVEDIISAIEQSDFLLLDENIYHVEVKTILKFSPYKLNRKRALLERRQRILGKLGLKPAFVVIIPRDNWEFEIEIELII